MFRLLLHSYNEDYTGQKGLLLGEDGIESKYDFALAFVPGDILVINNGYSTNPDDPFGGPDGYFAGLTCMGDATIILEGENYLGGSPDLCATLRGADGTGTGGFQWAAMRFFE